MIPRRHEAKMALLSPGSLSILTMVACSLAGTAWSREVTVRTRQQLISAAREAQAGTRILIAPGAYRGGLTFARLRGEAGRPVILAAADPEDPPVFRGQGSGMHLVAPAHVELHDLVFVGASGNGLNIDDGGVAENPAHHIVLRNLSVRDVGPEGNRDGIKLSGVDQFRVDGCTIERWGDRGGSAIDMVGCHDGEIVGCTLRYRSDVASSGIQAKGGSANIAVRRCRFDNAGARSINAGGSTGRAYFRPTDAAYEAKHITVEDCTFVGSGAPICFVGVDRAVFQYNTIYRPKHYVVRILQESRGERFVPSRRGVFRNNLVVFRWDELRGIVNIGPGTAPATFTFADNHWYCLDRPERSDHLSLPVEETGGTYGVAPQFVSPETGDLRLRGDSPVREAGVRHRSRDETED